MMMNVPIAQANAVSRALKILLVDDEPTTVQLVCRILHLDGHEVQQALDGEEALRLFRSFQPDLVLLDAVIPKIDGLTVLNEIRKQDTITGIIMFSALTSELLALQAMQGGADDFVNKPFRNRDLRMQIRRVMDKVQLRRQNEMLQQKLQAANEKLRHYMAPPLVQTLMESPNLPKLGGERQIVTVVFVDISSFTSIAQSMQPDELLRKLNDYFAYVSTAIQENGGMVDKIMGDGFMALFNVPETQPDHAMRAVRSAIAVNRRAREWNLTNSPQFRPRVGIHSGEAVVGNIGTSVYMNYTAIGDTVNLAKRLEEGAEAGEILISEATYQLLDLEQLDLEHFQIYQRGPTIFKGRPLPICVYRIRRDEPKPIDTREENR
jgi:class 3 adenylate cyclase